MLLICCSSYYSYKTYFYFCTQLSTMKYCLPVLFLIIIISVSISCKSKIQKKDKSLTEMQAEDEGNYEPVIAGADARVYKDVDGTKLHVNIFNPAAHTSDDARPCIVFFFGGAFIHGSPSQFTDQCKYFGGRGLVAITADYRVISRSNKTAIECVLDAKSCIRWIRENADTLGIDPDKIIMSGGSAGAALCLSAAMNQNTADEPVDNKNISCVPNAMVLYNPVVNFEEFEFRIRKFPNRAAEMNPLTHVKSNMPPAIIFHGTADKMSAYKFVEEFTEKMKAAGNDVELHSYEGMEHGFFQQNRYDGKYYDETLKLTDEWLVKKGYL